MQILLLSADAFRTSGLPRGDIWLALGRDDDGWVVVVESVFSQAHECSVLLNQQYEQRIGRYVADLHSTDGTGSMLPFLTSTDHYHYQRTVVWLCRKLLC